MFIVRNTCITQQILKKTRYFGLALVLFFVSNQGLSQKYFPQGSSTLTNGVPANDSLFYIPSGNWGFFDHFRNEMELERFLILNLTSYVDPDRFFVSVRYSSELPLDSLGQTSSQAVDQRNNQGGDTKDILVTPGTTPDPGVNPFRPPLNNLPVLPKFWERNNSGDSERIAEPSPGSQGTVSVPIENLEDPEGGYLAKDGLNDKFLLGKLNVHFIIDPEITPEVEELMGKVAFYSLKLYAFEEYEVSFERIGLYELFPEEEVEEEKQDSLIYKVDQRSTLDQVMKSDWMNTMKEWWTPLNLLYFLLVMSLLGLIFYLLLRKRSPESEKKKESLLIDKTSVNPEEEKKESHPDGITSLESEPELLKPTELENFQEYFVRNTIEIGKVFSHWIEDLGYEGLIRVHTILMPMGKNMFTLVLPYLSTSANQMLLKSFYNELPPVKLEERNSYLEKLIEIIHAKLGIDSLALLNSLDKEELFALIDLLEEKDAAKTLYHLDLPLRAEYLQNTLPFRAADILMNVTAIRSMSKGDYERLGDLISEKLVELRFFKKYRNKDLQFMLESLDSIDLDVQEIILENLKTADPVLHREIKKFQLSWSDVPGLDEELVRSATLGFTSNELGIAYRYGPDQISHIVMLRPERERELILELANQKGEVSEADAKLILKRLLTSIKTKLRADEKKN